MAERERLDHVAIRLDGRPLDPERYGLLSLVRVEESVQLPDAFTLRFDDPHFALLDGDAFPIGATVEIAFQAEADPVVVTTGEITALTVEPGPGGRHELVVSGLDVAHRLARGPRSRTFQQVTAADVATRVADEHGLEPDVAATPEVHTYLLQASETDHAFLHRLADRIGFGCWVSGKTLHFRERPAGGAPRALRWGDNLQTFTVRYSSAERCEEVVVRGWDDVGKQAITGRATDPAPRTTAPVAEELGGEARAAFGQVVRSTGHLPVADQAEADALAEALLATAAGGEVVARGTAAGDPALGAGTEVDVEGMGRRLSGRYRVTSATHVYGAGSPYVTRFTCGGREPATLLDLTRGTAAAAKRGWGSLVVGLVTNADDPQQLGRVKVRFPTLTDDDESTWARTAAPGAGPERGLQCLPEIGDEVLVGFEHDDLQRPVVLGGLWSGTGGPPDPDAVVGGAVEARLWRSRTGQTVELRDDPEPAVALRMGEHASALTLAGAESVLHGERALAVTGREIEVVAERVLVLRAPSVEIDGTTEVRVTGGTIRLN